MKYQHPISSYTMHCQSTMAITTVEPLEALILLYFVLITQA